MPRRPRPIRAGRLPEEAPAPTGQAAALQAAPAHELVRVLGAVPLLLPIFERLGLRELVNRRCHPEGVAGAAPDLGTVALLLVLKRLLAPRPLVPVETWLAGTALPDSLGLAADQRNADRLARALNALRPHLDALWQDLVVVAVVRFGLDRSRLCYDITSVSFCGDDAESQLVAYGYSRDHQPDRKQVERATDVTAEGGVPVAYRVLAGNVADATTPAENLRRLQALRAVLPARDAAAPWLVVSDRAMRTREALAAYAGSELRYLGPLDPGLGEGAGRAWLASVPAAELAAAPLAYRPQRAADSADWRAYRGVLRELRLPHPEAGQPPLVVRALVVWSPARARLDAQRRTHHLTCLETALQDLAGQIGRRPYTTAAAVERRVATLLRHHPARPFLAVTVGQGEAGPALAWARREEALAAAAAVDGRYALGTNDAPLDADQMLTLSKRRDVPEKRYATVKGPLAVRPVYRHKPERVLGLICCTMVALLAFAQLELLARRAALGRSGQALLAEFAPLAVLALVSKDGSRLRRLTGLAPPLVTTLQALGLPPAERYLTVHGPS